MKTNYQRLYDDNPDRLAIKNLDKSKYPALYKMLFEFWRGKLFRTLEYYWLVQDTKQNQHYKKGYHEFWESRRYSAEKGSYISRNHRVWQRNTVLLHCLGLIQTRRPRRKDGEWLPGIEHQSIVIMIEQGHHQPSTYFTTQLWTLDKLEYSEAQAQKWIDNRPPILYLTKEIIINIYGKELADEVYSDTRNTPKASARANQALKRAIIRTSKAKGYTTKSKVMTQLIKSIGKVRANKAWAVYGKQIMAEAGYRYHRPSKADKAKYGIKPNNNKWIIDKVEEAHRINPPPPREEMVHAQDETLLHQAHTI